MFENQGRGGAVSTPRAVSHTSVSTLALGNYVYCIRLQIAELISARQLQDLPESEFEATCIGRYIPKHFGSV